jgi:hypothetical protein
VVVRPIRNDAHHAAALRRIEELWEAPEGSEESDELEVFAILVSAYEDARWPTRLMFCATRWSSAITRPRISFRNIGTRLENACHIGARYSRITLLRIA